MRAERRTKALMCRFGRAGTAHELWKLVNLSDGAFLVQRTPAESLVNSEHTRTPGLFGFFGFFSFLPDITFGISTIASRMIPENDAITKT